MAKILLIASGKGGTGKTTVSSNLGHALANEGKRVLLIDTDSGFKGLDLALGVSERVVFSFLDVINQNATAKDAMVQPENAPNLYLISAPFHPLTEAVSFKQVSEFVASLFNKFDFIIIDCSAGFSLETSYFAKLAHVGIVVATPDEISLRNADKMNDLLIDSGLTNNFLILNRVRPKLIVQNKASNIDYAMDITYLPLLGVITEDIGIIECQNAGKSVFEKAKIPSKQAFTNIAKRVLGKQIPIMDMK